MHQRVLPGFDQQRFVTQPEAQLLLRDVEPFFWEAVAEPWKEFCFYRESDPNFHALDEGGIAWWMHKQVISKAKKLCLDLDHLAIRHFCSRQQEYFVIREQAVIVFKKLVQRTCDSAGCTLLERSNYRTKQNRAFWQQRIAEGFPDLPRFVLGYQLRRELTDIRLFIGYPRTNDRGFDWIYALQAIAMQASKTGDLLTSDEGRTGFQVIPRTDAIQQETA